MIHDPPIPRSDPDETVRDRRSVVPLAVGLALFALAVVLARATLPEWRAGELPSRSSTIARYTEILEASGVEPAYPDDRGVRVELTQSLHQAGSKNPYQILGPAAARWLLDQRRPLLVQVSGAVTTSEGVPAFAVASLGLDGRLWELSFGRASIGDMFVPQAKSSLPTPEEILLGPGESLGPPVDGLFSGQMVELRPIVPAGGETGPPEYLASSVLENGPATIVGRGVGDVESVRRGGLDDFWQRVLGKTAGNGLLVGGVAILAFTLALRRRIDLTNAALLTGLVTAVSVASAIDTGFVGTFDWIVDVLRTGFDAIYLLILWATAESLLRDSGSEATNALDLLRRGRVDRRIGRAALLGLGVGGVIAALALAANALGRIDGGLGAAFAPRATSVPLPPFGPGRTPLDLGVRVAGEVLLLLALARRVAPRRWSPALAIVAAALLRAVVFRDFTLFWADVAVGLVTASLLWLAYRRAGSFATLVAGLATFLLPALAFSAQHPAWMGGALAASSVALVGLGALGAVGLTRGETEGEPVEVPAFVARMEEERRVRYEMELLRRMQVGLLPRRVPEIPGWQIAARSMVAHEVGGDFYDFLDDGAGRRWIAAGDVAGHGSFCSISHAMTKAALASLVAEGRTPAEVLAEADRVLRTLDAGRIFTSLALLRIEPATGEALFANAGYPFPLVRPADGGPVREIELPGLPLGQGPERTYRDLAFALAPGEALVLASDGLFETPARDGEPYGWARYRAHLGAIPADTADRLLAALLARWRETVGDRPIEDDTTVVVVRRSAE